MYQLIELLPGIEEKFGVLEVLTMTEKNKLPWRFLFCLVAISTFLLILSSFSLLQASHSSFIPRSVMNLILLNKTSLYFNPGFDDEQLEFPFISSKIPHFDTNPPKKNQVPCLDSKHCKTLRVYMYDLPTEFHFGLLGWKGLEGQTWPDINNSNRIPPYADGLNLQHSMEYWLTLDLLSSSLPKVVRPCTAMRVRNSSEADIIFVPFFSSLSYNRHSKLHGNEKVSLNKILQDKLVRFLMNRDEWKRHGGKDHLIVAHHPNSMLDARNMLGSAMLLLADFGRYPLEIANLKKDIIAPYKHVVRTVGSVESASYDQRPTLMYFQGAIYRKDGGVIRQELYYLLKDEKNVHFTFGTAKGNGVHTASKGMASSKFCLNVAGDTPSSNRLFDAIASHCVPVIVSDEIELPFEDVLDYSEFCVFIRSSDAVKEGYLLNVLKGMEKDEWTRMWNKLKETVHHFEYNYPSQPADAVDMIWSAVSRKILSRPFQDSHQRRYHHNISQI